MNINKLDKLVDDIFSEMGKIEEGQKIYVGLLDKHGELIGYGLTQSFIVTNNVPHLHTLENIMDPESFKYIMDQVGNRLYKLYAYYPTNKNVSYYQPDGSNYLYGINHEGLPNT